MKNLALLGLASILFTHLTMPKAFANDAITQLSLVSIETDQFQDQTYVMGFNLDSNRNAVGLFYNDPYQVDPAKRLQNFTFDTLAAGPQTLITRSGHEIVKIAYSNNQLTLSYNRNATNTHSWSNKLFKVSCDAANNNCNVIDEDTLATTRDIFISTRRMAFITVGIDTIVSR
jgi:hypothetical protein